jgi:RNA-directed DNA polymerase
MASFLSPRTLYAWGSSARMCHQAWAHVRTSWPTLGLQSAANRYVGISGSVISPVIANMALDGLEARVRTAFPRYVWNGQKQVGPKVNFSRLADDFVITGATKALLEDDVKPLVEAFLKERGLTLSPEKTVITHIAEGLDFLGQHLRTYHGKLLIKPSVKSIKTLLRKVRGLIKANKSAAAGTLICHLNPLIRGWAMYHRHVVSAKVFQSVDHAIVQALWRCARRHHPNKGVRWVKARYFHALGCSLGRYAAPRASLRSSISSRPTRSPLHDTPRLRAA